MSQDWLSLAFQHNVSHHQAVTRFAATLSCKWYCDQRCPTVWDAAKLPLPADRLRVKSFSCSLIREARSQPSATVVSKKSRLTNVPLPFKFLGLSAVIGIGSSGDWFSLGPFQPLAFELGFVTVNATSRDTATVQSGPPHAETLLAVVKTFSIEMTIHPWPTWRKCHFKCTAVTQSQDELMRSLALTHKFCALN
jgi:hypothetical protein